MSITVPFSVFFVNDLPSKLRYDKDRDLVSYFLTLVLKFAS